MLEFTEQAPDQLANKFNLHEAKLNAIIDGLASDANAHAHVLTTARVRIGRLGDSPIAFSKTIGNSQSTS
jgi:hypothetical protein